MTDIAACEGKDCPIKENCYRFMCPRDEYQWYADFKYDHEKKECQNFYSIDGQRLRILQDKE